MSLPPNDQPKSSQEETQPSSPTWGEDSRNTEQLFAATLDGAYDDETPWDAVRALRSRGTPDVFELAKKYCESQNPRARARGLDVLAQLGAGKPDSERPLKDESVLIAMQHMKNSDPVVVNSAAWALAHLRGVKARSTLIANRHHTDADVRLAVATGIAGSTSLEAIQTLMELMGDQSDEVRDWATFGLGSQCIESDSGPWKLPDSPEIRAALRKRLDDSYEDVRDEALWGLAQRKEHSAVRLLLKRLEAESWKAGDQMAAEETLGLDSSVSVEQLREGLQQLLMSETTFNG